MRSKILVVDDEEDIRMSLIGILEDEGYEVSTCESGEEALRIMTREEVDVLFLDIWLTGRDGIDVLETVRREYSDVPVIMISGHGNIETAVQTIKMGAFDFIEKPLSLEKVVVAAKKALEFRGLQQENQDLRSRARSDYVEDISGRSRMVGNLRQQIDKVAPTDTWVLITGDNGTGKEIVARALHKKSRRSKRPMIAVNCAAIPEELIESVLFGHEKGAFTGADKSYPGRFELAHKGTLFLDEIGDMSLKTQAKILRLLEEQSFERVGGRKSLNVDVRLIAATNKDLLAEMRAGRFREDLYYRLNVFPLYVPSLRERGEDIPQLLEEFVQGQSAENGLPAVSFTDEALERIRRYPWPGNVRELKNFTERMLIMYPGQRIELGHLPPEIKETEDAERESRQVSYAADNEPRDFKQARAEFEKSFLEKKLAECQGNVSKLAELIGLERSYLHRKLKAYGINN
ncbi:MAG: sigma-54 dependent transcriptional regulator [Desulfohalobiaceae bacterium]|nr:sigma-54 dependent transcriptional regulator [Desulfohalobiaceae bacterium]